VATATPPPAAAAAAGGGGGGGGAVAAGHAHPLSFSRRGERHVGLLRRRDVRAGRMVGTRDNLFTTSHRMRYTEYGLLLRIS